MAVFGREEGEMGMLQRRLSYHFTESLCCLWINQGEIPRVPEREKGKGKGCWDASIPKVVIEEKIHICIHTHFPVTLK